MDQLDRFMKYTSGKEPVITVNVIAALMLAAFVKVTESYGFVWDELSFTIAGVIALSIATWVARSGVFSPLTHDAEVTKALYTPVPDDAKK
jgi:hypothetical protein